MRNIEISGAGSFVPEQVVTNAQIHAVVGQKDPGWIENRLGIRERRFLYHVSPESGRAEGNEDDIYMSEIAAKKALESADLRGHKVTSLWYASCTQPGHQLHFGHQGFELHRRLELSRNTEVYEFDVGCGGAMQVLHLARKSLLGGGGQALIVAQNTPSRFMDRELYVETKTWLSMYLFGDGAGAIVLGCVQSPGKDGILASYYGVDPTLPLMYFRSLNGRAPTYEIDAKAVAENYPKLADHAMAEIARQYPYVIGDIDRFYFHQVNLRILEQFCGDREIPWDRVAVNVDRYGNLAAASTLVLLDEDMRSRAVKRGDLCLFCTVGAGAQLSAALVRL